MKFNAHTIILTVVVLVVLYLLYLYFFSDSSDKTLISVQDARSQVTISPSSIPTGATADYAISIWFYVNDWNYRIGQEKTIVQRLATNENKPAPSITLGANTNDVTVALETYTSSGGTTESTCRITDVPLQRWTNLIMSINGRALDLYMDGKLVRTCILDGVPKAYSNTPFQICPNGGFSGFVSKFRFIAKSINPSQAYNIYKEGFGSSAVSGLLNKYRVKLSFMEENKEVNSFEL